MIIMIVLKSYDYCDHSIDGHITMMISDSAEWLPWFPCITMVRLGYNASVVVVSIV